MNNILDIFRFTTLEKMLLVPLAFQMADFTFNVTMSKAVLAFNYGFFMSVLSKMSLNKIKS